MAKFLQETAETKNGWSRWVPPRMSGYKMACCDCGLCHDFEFRVVKVKRAGRDRWDPIKKMDATKYRVHFRCRRNNKSTGQIRRHDKKKCKKN